MEEAAKMTEELQMKNWAGNHECVWPESQMKKMVQEKGLIICSRVLLPLSSKRNENLPLEELRGSGA